MQLKHLVPLALANGIAAQSANISLINVLSSQKSLSGLNAILAAQPNAIQALGTLSNVTLLAPNNDALARYLNGSSSTDAFSTDRIAALFQYHILNGTYYGSNFTNSSMFIGTALTNQTYSNVTNGQVVEGVLKNGNVTFYSGYGENSTVRVSNLNFTGGTIHIVDRVLTVPGNDTETLVAANLTAAAGALAQTNLAQNVSSLSDVTIFAPSNEAFSSISNLVANLSSDQLASILSYHVVQGTVAYSTRIQNGTVKAVSGGDLHITVNNGTVYVNSAKVIQANILVNNGVIHVIDNVLNPQNSTASPNPTASTQGPAFTGATSASSIPFTSGIPAPTSTAPIATAAKSSSSTGIAAPMKTGAVGVAALFGGAAAVIANL
jgi:uncharacterized surface protein with fasciclin (FAS1) repeats